MAVKERLRTDTQQTSPMPDDNGRVERHLPVAYARALDGAYIAYMTFGDLPRDLVYMPHWASNVEVMWENDHLADFLTQLTTFSRLITFDKRGVGLSDPVVARPSLPTLDSWVEDITAVLDDLQVERAVIMGHSVTGYIAALFAATHPERTSSLILVNSTARFRRAPDYPAGMPDGLAEAFIETMVENWGREDHPFAVTANPSFASDPAEPEFIARYQRATASPGTMRSMLRLTVEADVRAVLPSISVPTLVLHRRDNAFMRVGHGRYLAQNIPGARYVELSGSDHDPEAGDTHGLLAEIQEFLVGVRPPARQDRVLATVVFTDLVGSTELASRLGDLTWRRVLDRLDLAARREADRFRGEVIKSTGDGHLVVFDAPGRAIQWTQALMETCRGAEIQLRAGIHTGEVERRGADIGGMAVHIASRVSSLATAEQTLVTRTVRDLVIGSPTELTSAGTHDLKGVPGPWELFEVASP
jgi:class 3 adenylate cyclase